jgi:hypothetical protein
VVALPNSTNVFYGRDVGYSVERIVLDEATEGISATMIRRLAARPGNFLDDIRSQARVSETAASEQVG